ncbi:hypothetical protein D6779_04530 [Candidatus Parcubacteria bacterium]|nr:MAG: hypothetical protein D6779_04530 [Candidatus Parcubacteria bacterium]
METKKPGFNFGVVLVTGKSGAGKTWLIEALIEKQGGNAIRVDSSPYLPLSGSESSEKERFQAEVAKHKEGKVVYVEAQDVRDAEFLNLNFDRHIHIHS